MRLREQARDERRSQLAEVLRIEASLRGQLDKVDRAADERLALDRSASAAGVLDVDRLLDSQRYDLVLRDERQQLVRQLETLAAETDRRRATLVEADREVRVLERLRDLAAARQRREDQRQEASHLDEAALVPYCREETP
jgi:flagellar export protein FliJ